MEALVHSNDFGARRDDVFASGLPVQQAIHQGRTGCSRSVTARNAGMPTLRATRLQRYRQQCSSYNVMSQSSMHDHR